MKKPELFGMKRINLLVVFLLLSGMSGGASAEWVRIYGNDKLNAYADATSIRKKGNITKVLSLFDFREERVLKDGAPYQSIIRETEFNCKQNQQRMVSFAIYSAKNGQRKNCGKWRRAARLEDGVTRAGCERYEKICVSHRAVRCFSV